uniref:Uncharacterized protein n=1 Tax=Bracon brevicornis TaxID=1563983 RepID=A0A6V7JJ09_9HYME
MKPDAFWGELSTLRNDPDGEYSFRNLSTVALQILSLPHFEADSERIISKINLIKTKTRNKLMVRTVNGLVLANQKVKSSGGSSKFKPSRDMLSRITSSSLYGYKKKTTLEQTKWSASTSSAEFADTTRELIDGGLLIDEMDDVITFR